jgi:hypothetical protein
VAQASSAEDKEQWLAFISAQLDQQKTFLAALCDPKRYQNQLANMNLYAFFLPFSSLSIQN